MSIIDHRSSPRPHRSFRPSPRRMAKFLDIPICQFMGAVFELMLYGLSDLLRSIPALLMARRRRRRVRYFVCCYCLGAAKAEGGT
jgi:hypothetical protein